MSFPNRRTLIWYWESTKNKFYQTTLKLYNYTNNKSIFVNHILWLNCVSQLSSVSKAFQMKLLLLRLLKRLGLGRPLDDAKSGDRPAPIGHWINWVGWVPPSPSPVKETLDSASLLLRGAPATVGRKYLWTFSVNSGPLRLRLHAVKAAV